MGRKTGMQCYSDIKLEELKKIHGNPTIKVSRVWVEKYNAAAELLGGTPIQVLTEEVDNTGGTDQSQEHQESQNSSGGVGNVQIG